LSRTTPLTTFSEGGWYPKANRGERRSRRIQGLMPCTFFHNECGMPSGAGVEEWEDLLRTCLISSMVRESAEGSGDRRPLGGRGS